MTETICVFGASTTWGAWDKELGGWVNRLRLFFDKTEKVSVYNLGVDGDNTDEILERFEIEAKAREPSVIIFSVGCNDSILQHKKKNKHVPLDRFERNLVLLVRKAKKFTQKIVFLGLVAADESKTKPVHWDDAVSYTNESIARYDAVVRGVVEKEKVHYVDMAIVAKDDLADGLHPTAKGHQKIFMKVRDFLVEKKLV